MAGAGEPPVGAATPTPSSDRQPLRGVAGQDHEPPQAATSPRARVKGGRKKLTKQQRRQAERAAREAAVAAAVEQQKREIRENWGLDDLDEVDRQLLAHKLATPSIENTALSTLIGLGREAISRRVNRPAFKRALEESQLTVLAIIAREQPRAAKRMAELINSADDMVALKACAEFLRPVTRRAAQLGGTPMESFTDFLNEVAKRPTADTPPAPAPPKSQSA